LVQLAALVAMAAMAAQRVMMARLELDSTVVWLDLALQVVTVVLVP
jgi:hypothetical protein